MSKRKRKASEPIKVRSVVARSAYERGGAGTHIRRRVRSTERRRAIADAY